MESYKTGTLMILESTFFKEIFKLAKMFVKQI